ncbi:MAG: PH domain-containing protein [Acidimicrobiales bacterium]
MAQPTDSGLPAEADGPNTVETANTVETPNTVETTGETVEGGKLDHLDWRRPHPLTILLELGRAIRSIIIAVVVVSGGVFSQAAFFETALLAAPFAAAVGRWYTTRYAIDETSVHRHHGLFWRTKQVLPRANIQNVTTKATLLARMGSVVDLQVSDASATGDIRLRVITQDEADRLTTLLRSSIAPVADTLVADTTQVATPPVDARSSTESSGDTQASPGHLTAPAPGGPSVDRAPLVEASARELLKAELTATSTILFTMLAAVAISAFTVVFWLEPYEIEVAALPSWVTSWMVLLAGIFGALVLTGFSVAQRLLALGGFRLWADPDRLRIRVGLLTEARIAARRERIQQIRVERDLAHRLMGIERVDYETADLEVEGTAGSGYLAPVAAAGRWRELSTEVFGEVQLDESDLRPVSPKTVRRVAIRFAITAIPMLALGLLNPALMLVAAVWAALGWVYSRARYRALGYACSNDQLLVRQGVFYGRLTLVRLDKVQIVRTHATYFQRRLGLATLRLSTAGRGFGGIVSLPDLPDTTTEELRAALTRRAGSTPIADTL